MAYRIRDGLHFRFVDDSAIFLDLENDRYMLAPPPTAAAFRDFLIAGSSDLDPGGPLAPLLRRGYLIHGDHAAPNANLEPIELEPQVDGPSCKAATGMVALALIEQLRVGLVLKARPLSSIIASIRRRKNAVSAAQSRPEPQDVAQCAAAFRTSTKYLPSDGKCLRRSIALMSHLLRKGAEVDLVFGVRLRPFGAHCWVQREGTVL